MELWEQALELEHFIRDFVPPYWKYNIQSVMFVPVVLERDITIIKDHGIIPAKFDGVMKLAIRAWLLKGKDNASTQP